MRYLLYLFYVKANPSKRRSPTDLIDSHFRFVDHPIDVWLRCLRRVHINVWPKDSHCTTLLYLLAFVSLENSMVPPPAIPPQLPTTSVGHRLRIPHHMKYSVYLPQHLLRKSRNDITS